MTPEEVLAAAPSGWGDVGGKLTKNFTFATFAEGIAFVGRVGALADEHDHHPDIDVRWTTVTLAVNTHDAGGALTARDLKLAEAVEAL